MNCVINRIGDQLLNNNLIVYIEKDVFDKIDNNEIMQYFQNWKRVRNDCNKVS